MQTLIWRIMQILVNILRHMKVYIYADLYIPTRMLVDFGLEDEGKEKAIISWW